MKERKNKEELNEIEEKDLPKAEGLIIKATGGFYYVRSGETTFECRARGIFRKREPFARGFRLLQQSVLGLVETGVNAVPV